MAAELAAKFPEIKTYLGEGVDDPRASVRFDLTPAGFHAQILSPEGTVYIDPAFRGESGFHTSYFKRDLVRASDDFRCWLDEKTIAASRGGAGTTTGNAVTPLDLARSGGNLRTYRLAVAATGEYTAYHGGTVSAGLAAIVTAVNRVTGVYETELAIRLVLVGNNDLVVYTNSATDPYSNSSPSSLLTQNQSTLDNLIGSANYDIGHVFSTAGGGLAGLGVVCLTGQKARGETGMTAPIGDAFYIDYVAHEMGHQFGGNHTFNSSTSNCGGGNRNASTAYEQGSGSTIMAYAGICGSDDLQPHSDPYFNFVSFDEIVNYSTVGSGNGCAVVTSTGNTAPTVSAGPNYTIPQNTPFTLTASGSDPNGDPLTYCWEERDLGASTTVTAPDNGSSPLFRSWNPTVSPSRTFPRLQNLLNNTLPIGEVMPTTTRTLNFRVTARDNRAGGGGVNTADMQVNVTAAAGPFVITSHNSGGTFFGLQTVTWNVAGTTNAPVSAANVNILLSTNGGQTFPIVLSANTPNDGSQTVVFPDLSNNVARLQIEAVGNIFFDLVNSNFTVQPAPSPMPLVGWDSTALVAENCALANNAIDPGETVTVNVALRNTGSGNTTNLTATLLVTNGVTLPSGPQIYGQLVAGGAAVTQAFSFTATGSCGGALTAVLQLQDGASNLGTVTRAFSLGSVVAATTQRTNSTTIAIPASGTKGAATPFPSTLTVSGVTGTVSKVTVALNGFDHTWPADVDALLVGPGGQTVLLLSDAGGGNAVSSVNLTFDDEAATTLSETAAITSGTYKPTNYGTGDTFSSPAPGGAYGSALAVFNGVNPNGNWSLYMQDDGSQDTGDLLQGWQLSITTSNASCCVSNPPISELAIGQTVLPSLLNVGSNLVFTLSVTNNGPDSAASVVVTNPLPAGVIFDSAVVSAGAITNDSGVITWTIGSLASNEFVTAEIQAAASQAGSQTNLASVSCSTIDPITANNTASVVFSVNQFPSLSALFNVTNLEDVVIGPLAFTVGDLETAATGLSVIVSCSDTNLLPLAGLSLGGSGSNRSLTITPAADQSGVATVTVTVSDGLATTSGSFVVEINPVNDAPVLAAITNLTILEGATLVFTNLATDVEAPLQTVLFSLENAPSGVSLDPMNGVFAWTPDETQGGTTNELSIIVTDDGVPSLTATQLVTIVVLEANTAPTLAPIADFTITEGELISFTNSAADFDLPANGLSFSLLNGPTNAVLNPESGEFTWLTGEADGPGTNVIQIVVADNGIPSLSATQTFTVIVLETNGAPVLAPLVDRVIFEGEQLTFTNSASDPDHGLNTLTFTMAPALAGASVDATNGVFTWLADESQGGTTNLISIIVTDDGTPSLSATQSFTVVVLETNSPPTLASISNFTLVEGETLSFTNVFADADEPANQLTFSLLDGPTNAVLEPASGVLTWVTSEADGPGSNYISIVLADDGSPSLSVTQSFAVVVLETNAPPELAPIGDFTIVEGDVLTFTNQVSDPDLPVNLLSFTLAGAPTNAVINPTNGIFVWQPDEFQGPGTNVISVIVTDDGLPSLTATQTFTVVVLETNAAPLLAPIADQKIHAGMTLILTNQVQDFDWPPNTLAFELAAGSPLTASIGPADGVFTWTPTDADANTVQSVTVRATDDGVPPVAAEQTFLVTVASRPLITDIQVDAGQVVLTWTSLSGRAYRLQSCTNLDNPEWLDAAPEVVAGGPFTSTTNLLDAASLNLFRVRVVP